MNDKLKSLAMLEIAEELLKASSTPITIQDLMKQVAEIKGVDVKDVDRLTQLYMDITQSAKFVYCGDDQWDLKERNLELWDKDGYAFVHAEEIEPDEEDDPDFTEYTLEEVEEDEAEVDEEEDEVEVDEEIKEEKAYIEIDLPIKSTDEDDGEDDVEIEYDKDDYDEDDYNEIMDDYEDMYDE